MKALDTLGQPITAKPLELVRHLEAFDGPILSEYRDPQGAAYLEKWCAHEPTLGTTRMLRVATRHRAIVEYVAGRRDMRALLIEPNANVGLLVDTDARGTILAAALVVVTNLPPEYLPQVGAFHEEEFRPTTGTARESFLLDEGWDGAVIARLEKNFIDVAAFAHATGPTLGPTTPQYRYQSGWAYNNAFVVMRGRMPRAARPKSAAVEASSPGVLSIDAPADTATSILNAMRAARRHDTQIAYSSLHEWSKLNYDAAGRVPLVQAERDLRDLCQRLGVTVESLWVKDPDAESPHAGLLTAGKLIAAYFRRIWKILRPTGAQNARPEFATDAVPESLDTDEHEPD